MKLKLIGFLLLSAVGLFSIYNIPENKLETTIYIERTPSSVLTYATAEHLKSQILQSPKPLVVVNFWASWCAPCIEELPGLANLKMHTELPEVKFLFVSLDTTKDLAAAQELIKKHELISMVKHPKDKKFMSTIYPAWSGVIPVTMVFSNNGEALEVIKGAVTAPELLEKLQEIIAEFK